MSFNENDEFTDLLIQLTMQQQHEGNSSLEQVKEFLHSINHPQKDNPSFAYNFWVWCGEPYCIKL